MIAKSLDSKALLRGQVGHPVSGETDELLKRITRGLDPKELLEHYVGESVSIEVYEVNDELHGEGTKPDYNGRLTKHEGELTRVTKDQIEINGSDTYFFNKIGFPGGNASRTGETITIILAKNDRVLYDTLYDAIPDKFINARALLRPAA